MKILGLVGGTTWHSTSDYYRYINEGVHSKLGSVHSARLILHSLDFAEVNKNNEAGNWSANMELVVNACKHMKDFGAEGIVLCANTMHMHADHVQQSVQLPIIHIADATANAIKRKGLRRVLLMGTRFTMEMAFFRSRLLEQGIEAVIPNEQERNFIHESIFKELGLGIFTAKTRAHYLDIMERSRKEEGVEGAILGCTEIPMLIRQEDTVLPVFDTTRIHADAAVEFATGISF